MNISTDRKKELKESYANRCPDMGIVSWTAGGQTWVMASTDIKADYNGMSFQLKLGSWPEKKLQSAYNQNKDNFEWTVEAKLEYEDPHEDHSDDLELLLMEYMEKHPGAMPMKPSRKR